MQTGTDARMRLETLELLERRQAGIGVAESDDETDGDPPIILMVKETAAIYVRRQRPTAGMHDTAGTMVLWPHFPDFLDAQRVGLRRRVGIQAIPFDQALPEITTTAFGEQGVFTAQRHAGLEIRAGRTIAPPPEIAGQHATDDAPAIRSLVKQDVVGDEAGKYLDAQRLGLLRQPAAQCAKRNDVMTGLMQTGGQQTMRRLNVGVFGEPEKCLLRHAQPERRIVSAPIGHAGRR